MSALTTVPRPRRVRRLVAAASAVAAAVLLPLAVPSAAQAHWAVVETSPADGSVVDQLPEEVSFTFSGPLLDGAPQSLFITDESCVGIEGAVDNSIPIDPASCTDYASGDAVAEGPKLTQAIDTAGAPAGEYTMVATVVYSDGHSESLVRRFEAENPVGAAGTETPAEKAAPEETTPAETPGEETAAPSTPADDDPSPSDAPGEDAVDADEAEGAGALPWILGGAGVVVVGIAVAVLVSRSRRSS